MAHLNSAEGIQNMCATQIMTKSPKEHPVCLKAQRFVVILSAHK